MYKEYLSQRGVSNEYEGYVGSIVNKEIILERRDSLEERIQEDTIDYHEEQFESSGDCIGEQSEDVEGYADEMPSFLDGTEEEMEGGASDLVSMLKSIKTRDESIEDLDNFEEDDFSSDSDEDIAYNEQDDENYYVMGNDGDYIEEELDEEDIPLPEDESNIVRERRLQWEESQGYDYEEESTADESDEEIAFFNNTQIDENDEEYDVMVNGVDFDLEDDEDIVFEDNVEEEEYIEDDVEEEEYNEDDEDIVFENNREEEYTEDDEDIVFENDEEEYAEDEGYDEDIVFENNGEEDDEDIVFDNNGEEYTEEDEDEEEDDEDIVFENENEDEDPEFAEEEDYDEEEDDEDIVFHEPTYDVAEVGSIESKGIDEVIDKKKSAEEQMMREFDMVMATNLEKFTMKGINSARKLTNKFKNKLLEGVEEDD